MMKEVLTKYMKNGEACPICEIPSAPIETFLQTIGEALEQGMRVVQYFAVNTDGKEKEATLYTVLADNSSGKLYPLTTQVRTSFPSLTPSFPQIQLFEREIWEQTGIEPVGHPWLKPVRVQGENTFFSYTGDQVHEVGVGPVHAGVIEPGHFRFQCHGEKILNLEISLGYQHRGIEKRLIGGPDTLTIHQMETASGDATIGHTLTYCSVVDALKKQKPTAKVEAIQALSLELERLANHVGDLGALAGDVGYLPTKSFCGRLRGELLNLTAVICGNRFGRNLLRPGEVRHDLSGKQISIISDKLKTIIQQSLQAVDLLWDNPSVLSRFDHTGTLERSVAEELGAVGPAARACGIRNDVRSDFPTGKYERIGMPVALCETGDVFARALIRRREIVHSRDLILEILKNFPEGSCIYNNTNDPAPDSFAISLTEGWRGEICHCALTDSQGTFAKYKIVDPSFHNWYVLSRTLRNVEISDFPLCNKSFNLSYCGFDL